MNILELDSYNLADAVKFNDRLNPVIWDGETMRPQVREKLLAIADDFREFLGLTDLEVKDVTVSGSNAGYTYTPQSDIDLHLVVDIPQADADEVYRELFDAKKYQYNDQHNITIGGYDVELYVENANQPPVSKGVYSVLKDDWINIPRRVRAEINDDAVRSRYDVLKNHIESAIDSDDAQRLDAVARKIKRLRQTGLAAHGELGPENLAFKMLRTQGLIKKLYDARTRAQDQEFSLKERQRVRYGFASVNEAPLSSPDGVSPDTKMFLSEKDLPTDEQILDDFVDFCVKELKIQHRPTIKLRKDPQWPRMHQTFGRYMDDKKMLEVAWGQRHVMDVLRTVAHELTHKHQHERDGARMGADAGETGSPWENEANARAGILMRDYARLHPEYFVKGQAQDLAMAESASGYIPTAREKNDPRYKMALTVDVQPGQVGKEANKLGLKTDRQGHPGLLMKSVNLRESQVRDLNNPPGPEFRPTMPRGTVRVDVSDVYDWYKLGKNIANLDRVPPGEFGKGPPSTIVSFGDEDTEHKYIKGLERLGLTTTDIDPVDPSQPPGMPRQKVDPTYNVSEAFDQPYALTWEQGDHGDWSASAKLPDGNYIEILFTRWDHRLRDIWDVEFYRNHSQDVTGEGDAMRVFATVMQAIGEFVKKIKPATVKLAATKDVEPGVKPESRARLYQRMARRFAADMGYQVQVQDRGIQVNFEFTRQTSVAEGDVVPMDAYRPTEMSAEFINWLRANYPNLTMKDLRDPQRRNQLYREFKNSQGVTDRQTPVESTQAAEDDLVESLRSEFELLENEILGEIRMSPKNLRSEAAKTGAIAGMEFEMIVPGVADPDPDVESEPDFDMNESVNGIEDACQFFYDGDYNSRRDIANLREEMTQQYEEWYDDRQREKWEEESSDYIRDWLWRTYEDDWREEARSELGDEASDEQIEEFVTEKWDSTTDDVLANMGSDWDAAYEEWSEDFRANNDLEDEWLQDQGWETMLDIRDNFDIAWPHYYTPEPEGDNINTVADDFSDAVGMPVNASSNYHGGRREPGHYVVEPDGSLEPDDSSDQGLEFVSPPMPIDQLLDQLKKVKTWAGRYGCYTNESTGLHINISVPNYDLNKLDYVKLALMMGDEYVLDQFGRSSNTYTKSAMAKIREILRSNPDAGQAVLDKMKGHMDDLATKAIHSGSTSKYTSINTKDGYIEFRSPGGDWLDENFDKVENTLLRFTVALSAAMDPAAYREEYLKKLYKLLGPKGDNDPISYFAKYSAGQLPKAALRSFVKQAQLQRRIKRGETGDQPMWWRVDKEGRGAANGASIEVVAKSQQEALQKASYEWNIRLGAMPDAEAYPIRPYDQSPVQAQVGEPQAIGQRSGPTLGDRPSNPDGNYVITPEGDRHSVYYRFQAVDIDDANTVLRQWRQQYPNQVWVAQRDDHRMLGQPPVPGSTLDLQRQRAAQAQQSDPYRSVPIPGVTDVELDIPQAEPRPLGAGRELLGWSVLLPNGREVTQIRGIGNNQGDANRIAADWLRRNGYGVSGEGYSVVPLWGEA